MANDYPLGSLGLQIKAHWKKYRPRMYKELEKSGKLLESVYAAQELTNDLMDRLLAKRMPHHQAWEIAREEWAFLPSERDEPNADVRPDEPDRADVEPEPERAARQKREQEPRSGAHDYRITDRDAIGQGTAREKSRANLDAIRLLKSLEGAVPVAGPSGDPRGAGGAGKDVG